MIPKKFKQTEIGKIPTEWEVVKLGNICEVKSGKRLPMGRFLVEYKTNHPYIRVRDLQNRTIKVNELLFLDEETFKKISRYLITKDDVYISIVGSIGMVGLVPENISGANLTENCARLTNLNRITKEWLSYFLNSRNGQNQIKSLTVGTTQGKLALFRIKDIEIPLPPLPEQLSIASILSSLDAKIELNQQMNKTLEAIGQAIFKKWFVDIEKIPEGWKTKPLDEVAEFLNGLALQKYPAKIGEEFLPAIKIKELRNGITNQTDKTNLDLPKNYIINNGDILFSWSGSLEVVIWTNGKGALNQHLFKVSSKEYPKWFYYFWTKHYLPEFRNIAEDKATTMGHIQRRHLTESEVLVPDKKSFEEMSKLMIPLIDKIINLKLESQTLSAIRDALLPKLMNGEVRIK